MIKQRPPKPAEEYTSKAATYDFAQRRGSEGALKKEVIPHISSDEEGSGGSSWRSKSISQSESSQGRSSKSSEVAPVRRQTISEEPFSIATTSKTTAENSSSPNGKPQSRPTVVTQARRNTVANGHPAKTVEEKGNTRAPMASLLFSAGYVTYDKIKRKRAEKKESKRRKDEERYEDLKREQEQAQTRRQSSVGGVSGSVGPPLNTYVANTPAMTASPVTTTPNDNMPLASNNPFRTLSSQSQARPEPHYRSTSTLSHSSSEAVAATRPNAYRHQRASSNNPFGVSWERERDSNDFGGRSNGRDSYTWDADEDTTIKQREEELKGITRGWSDGAVGEKSLI